MEIPVVVNKCEHSIIFYYQSSDRRALGCNMWMTQWIHRYQEWWVAGWGRCSQVYGPWEAKVDKLMMINGQIEPIRIRDKSEIYRFVMICSWIWRPPPCKICLVSFGGWSKYRNYCYAGEQLHFGCVFISAIHKVPPTKSRCNPAIIDGLMVFSVYIYIYYDPVSLGPPPQPVVSHSPAMCVGVGVVEVVLLLMAQILHHPGCMKPCK